MNLTPLDRPEDLYSAVAARVQEKVASIIDEGGDRAEVATLLRPFVTRKLVKQTVMTSVYGVTYPGASAQIAARLREVNAADKVASLAEVDDSEEVVGRLVFSMRSLATTLTFESLGDVFVSSKSIMGWLRELCSVVVSVRRERSAAGGHAGHQRPARPRRSPLPSLGPPPAPAPPPALRR